MSVKQLHMRLDLISISNRAEEIFHTLRWGSSGVCCPRCGSIKIYNQDSKIHICGDCRNHFSDTSNTIFHSTKIPLSKWLYAIYIFITSSRGISSYNLSRSIQVSQPTAWRMLSLLRSRLSQDLNIMNEEEDIIADEIWFGADWKKMQFKRKLKKATALGLTLPKPKGSDKHSVSIFKGALRHTLKKASNMDKICIVGISAYNKRSLYLRPFIYDEERSLKISRFIAQIPHNKHLVSDESALYKLFPKHSTNNHSINQWKSDDGYSSNRLEGAFAHFRRFIRGTYQWISKRYSAGYINEFCFRWNNPNIEDRLSLLFECLV